MVTAGHHDHGVQTDLLDVDTSGQQKKDRLQNEAATAALYVTKSDRAGKHGSSYPLDNDNKLSAAGAATSLKYANPQDLPSFPVSGLGNGDSAGTAATLANKNQKTFEHWKPDASASASTAAMLAKDYKAPEIWQPELSSAGSKAALLAARDGGHVDVWRPKESEWGISAATQAAWRSGQLSSNAFDGLNAEGHRKSLIAATGAVTNSRRRAGSTPAPVNSFPDASNSAANALKGATIAARPHPTSEAPHEPTGISPSLEAARIQHAHTSRQMYTSTPPVSLEVDEKRKQDTLHAAAVSMAKKMYAVQDKSIKDGVRRSDSQSAAIVSHGRKPSRASTTDETTAPMRFNSLEEAAKKLAADRLAKLHDEHAAYRSYYGTSPPPPTSKLSIRGKPRRRASSEGRIGLDDAAQSRKIRSEMSQFSDRLAEVDTKKRQKDRDALMAAAQRNVRASMHGMDERVYQTTGKASPSMKEGWEAKAREAAEAESRARMSNYGKVNIGGGKYLDQSAVDAVALKNVQPVLDEINDNAERQRAKDAEMKMQQENAKTVIQQEKAREKVTREEVKRINALEKEEKRKRKAEEKAAQDRQKEEEKVRKMAEKAHRDDEKRRAKEDWQQANQQTKEVHSVGIVRKTKDRPPERELASESDTPEQVAAKKEATAAPSASNPPQMTSHSATAKLSTTALDTAATTTAKPTTSSPTTHSSSSTPTSPKSDSRVKSWLKTKFSTHKSGKSRDDMQAADDSTKESPASFVGGAALTGATPSDAPGSNRESSVRDVALAGRHSHSTSSSSAAPNDIAERRSRARQRSASPDLSAVSPAGQHITVTPPSLRSVPTGEDVKLDAQGGVHTHAHPGLAVAELEKLKADQKAAKRVEGDDDDDDKDEFEEARDTFESEPLAPPRKIGENGYEERKRESESPGRETKFREEIDE